MKCPKCKKEIKEILSLTNLQAPYGWEPVYAYLCEKDGRFEIIPNLKQATALL